ncbi:MAG: GntR family transcriptional regulator [Candidatus Velthaea sp.]
MPANFNVDPRSGVPIYVQLIDQVKRSIAVGALAPGERLPTVKQLAVDLTVNPNTVARAYRDLERDGAIDTSPGRGSFVREGGAVDTRRNVLDVAAVRLEDAIRDARSIGVGRAELLALVERLVERWFPQGADE